MFLILLLLAVPLGILLFVRLRKSNWVGKLTDDLIHEPDDSFVETDSLIGSAKSADEALIKREKDNLTAVSELKKDTDKIAKFKGKGDS